MQTQASGPSESFPSHGELKETYLPAQGNGFDAPLSPLGLNKVSLNTHNHRSALKELC